MTNGKDMPRNGMDVLRDIAKIGLPAILAVFGAWLAVSTQIVRLEERIVAMKDVLSLQQEYMSRDLNEVKRAVEDNRNRVEKLAEQAKR